MARFLPAWIVAAWLAGLLLHAFGAMAADGADHQRRVALVIGNSSYVHAPKLPNPKNDALAITNALRGVGFDVQSELDLDKQAMERALRRFSNRLKKADVALFFYAGHSVQVNGINYLVPTDAVLREEADLDFEVIPVNLLLRQMERQRRTNLMFLDACRDNPLVKNLARSMGADRSTMVGSGLAPMEGALGMMIAYATQPGNVALDGAGKNSPFTAALLSWIDRPGLEVRQVMTRVRQEVISTTDGKQVPWDHSSLTGDFYFVPPLPKVTKPQTDDARAFEFKFWESIENSSNPEEFQAYLDQYGENSSFSALARARRDRLLSEQGSQLQAALPREAVPEPVPAPTPAPTPSPAPLPAFQIDDLDRELVVLRGANVRAGPSTDYEKVGFLKGGTKVTVTGKVRGARWFRIALDGRPDSYMHRSLLGPEPEPEPTDSASDKALDLAFWNQIRNSEDPADFETYLGRYPKGEFAHFANTRLGELRKSRAAVAPAIPQQSEVASLEDEPAKTSVQSDAPAVQAPALSANEAKAERDVKATEMAVIPPEDSSAKVRRRISKMEQYIDQNTRKAMSAFTEMMNKGAILSPSERFLHVIEFRGIVFENSEYRVRVYYMYCHVDYACRKRTEAAFFTARLDGGKLTFIRKVRAPKSNLSKTGQTVPFGSYEDIGAD